MTTTGLVTVPFVRHIQNYLGDLEHTLSEKAKADLFYNYSSYDYSKTPQLLNLNAHDANLRFIYDLGSSLPNTDGRMNFGYSRYEFRTSTINYYYATLGMGRALSEKWNLLFNVGGSYTFSEFTAGSTNDKEEGVGWVGMGTLSYKGEKTTADLDFSHRTMPASGSVGVTERTSLTLGMTHRFTYEFSGGLSASCYINEAQRRGNFQRWESIPGPLCSIPWIRYEFTRNVSLEVLTILPTYTTGSECVNENETLVKRI